MEQQPPDQQAAPNGTPLCDLPAHDLAALRALEAKIHALLPEQYQHCYDAVSPTSMGSAGLKFGRDGKVAWGEIWTTFCHLALAGGPPHRGTLLEPVLPEEVASAPDQYQAVVEEIGRGLWLTTELPVLPRAAPGWVGVRCWTEAMAVWLVRAIVAENVSARNEREMLYLPAGPQFRLEREIKNVVTVLAKTCHYWSGHLSASQRDTVAGLVKGAAGHALLAEPASPAEARAAADEYQAVVDELERGLREATGLPTIACRVAGWVGLQCADESTAIWLMRAAIAEDVLSRREGAVCFLPAALPRGDGARRRQVIAAAARARRLWDVHLARSSSGAGSGERA